MYNAAQKSVSGIDAHKKYCIYTNAPFHLVRSQETFRLGSGIYSSLGSTLIRFPIDNFGNFLEYGTDVIVAKQDPHSVPGHSDTTTDLADLLKP